MDVEEFNPMDLLSTDLSTETDNVDPLSIDNKPDDDDDDDDDVQLIIQEPVIIDILDDEPEPESNPPTSNGITLVEELPKPVEEQPKPVEAQPPIISFGQGQFPDSYTEEEQAVFKNIFGPGQQAVEFHRLHCTACNIHLGSAPSDQSDRYVHPLLKVIICKSCFDFYGSGDFGKDDDGSELHCRWCGQGGKVLCCAQCPHVFCQRCIRTNLGKKGLDTVKASDDWLCFVCNPNQIIKLRVTSRALYDYVQEELQRCQDQRQTQNLSRDKSLCCKAKATTTKRKDDEAYVPEGQKKKRARTTPASSTPKVTPKETSTSWNTTQEDEVVCTPDLSLLMDEEETRPEPNFTMSQNDPLADTVTESLPPPLTPIVSHNKKATGNLTQTSNQLGYTIPPKLLKKVQSKTKVNNVVKKQVSLSKLQYDWFEKAKNLAVEANRILSTKLDAASQEQWPVQSLASLAQMHNNLQEVLGTTVNSLIQIRKSFRSDFIASLKKLQFTEETDRSSPLPIVNNNDVIVVDPTPIDNDNFMETSHNNIDVAPSTQLLSSPVISIPDDAVQESTTVVESPTVVEMSPVVESPMRVDSPTVVESAPSTPKPQAPEPENELVNDNPTEDLSELTESLNPETVTQIKRALLESKFEKIMNESLSVNSKLPQEAIKKMASVRVILSPSYEVSSSRVKQQSPRNMEKIQNQSATEMDELEDIENILSASMLINPAKKAPLAKSVDDSDEQSDPLAVDDDSVNNDGSMSNGTFDDDGNLNDLTGTTTEGIAVL